MHGLELLSVPKVERRESICYPSVDELSSWPGSPIRMRSHKSSLIAFAFAAAALFALVAPAADNALRADDGAEPYKVRSDAPSVTVNADGTATVTFEVTGEYHWNREYPAKLTVGTPPKVVSLGKTVFKQLSGDFEVDGQGDSKTARVKVPFKGVASGNDKAPVQAKFSVCNDKVCLIKSADLNLDFVVSQ
jgi:hypothetical protein